MYWANYHSHCTFCDGRSSMEEFVKFAIAKGVKKYGFSSHAPLPFNTFWNMKTDDFSDYQTEFQRLKTKYATDLELFIGLEADYINDYFQIENDLFDVKNLDYLIGSIHYTDRLENGDFWTIDGNFPDFEKGLTELYDGDIWAAVQRYFEISKKMIGKGGFQILGHFDKIAMNGSKCKGFDKTAPQYLHLVGEMLEVIKSNKLILEINTKSLAEKGITYPDQQFYSLINELEIPVVVNSDCHYPTTIIDGFEQTFKALKNAGFTTMHQYLNKSWQAVEFNENGLLF